MRRDWQFFLREVEDEAITLHVDLNLEDPVRRPSLPKRLSLTVATGPGVEADQAPRIRGALEAVTASSGDRALLTAMRISTKRIGFLLHTDGDPELERALVAAVDSAAGTTPESTSAADASWEAFRELLPTAAERQSIRNFWMLERLAAHGDRIERAREVEHCFWLPSAESLETLAATLVPRGFAVVARTRDPTNPLPFGLQLVHRSEITLAAMDAITSELLELVAEHGGRYDGWGSDVTR